MRLPRTPEEMFKVFCPTGEGGGIDPTCSPGGGEGSGREMTLEEFKNFPLPKPRSGHVIVYHRLSRAEDLDSVLKEGLKTSKKKPGGEGPKDVIWGADDPNAYSRHGTVIGFEVPKEKAHKTGNQYMVYGDIGPTAIKFVDTEHGFSGIGGPRWRDVRTGSHVEDVYNYLKELGKLPRIGKK